MDRLLKKKKDMPVIASIVIVLIIVILIANKEVKKSIKCDKKKVFCVESIGTSRASSRAEELERLVVRKLARSRPSVEQPVEGKEGQLLLNPSEQLKGEKGHFEELMNRPAPVHPPDSPHAETPLQILTEHQKKK